MGGLGTVDALAFRFSREDLAEQLLFVFLACALAGPEQRCGLRFSPHPGRIAKWRRS